MDNHRDLLMLSLKQRLGIPWDGKVDMSRVLTYLPSGWSVPLLLTRFAAELHVVPRIRRLRSPWPLRSRCRPVACARRQSPKS